MNDDYELWLEESGHEEVDDRELQDIAFYYDEEDALQAGYC